MSTLLYLHGFNSSPRSAKATQFRQWLSEHHPDVEMIIPQLPPYPAEAAEMLESIVLAHGGETFGVVGSSLGGYYATWLAEKYLLRAALINPAVIAPISLQKYLGPQTNLHTGKPFEFTEEHIARLRALEAPEITPGRYFLMLETGDEVLDYRNALQRYAGCRQAVFEGGDHSFTRFPEMLPQLFEFCGL